MSTLTTSVLPNNLHSYYHKMLLATAEMNLKFYQLGKKKLHPKGTGTDSYMLKFGHVAESTTELTEGVPPSATTIATNKYTVVVKQYGQVLRLSDKLITTAIDPVLQDVTKEMGYAAAKSTDTIIRNHLESNATTNIQYAGTGNSADNDIVAGDILTVTDALKAVRVLKGSDAPTMDDGYYTWVVHNYNAVDMMGDTAAGGFIELNKYVQGLADKPLKGEIGKAYGVRIVESNNIRAVANSGTVPVYRTFVMAKDAFAVTSWDKDHTELIVKQAGSAGTADPLNQIATVGYKLQFGVKYVGGDFSDANGSSPDLAIQVRGAAVAI
jgi:N4-gp56 family major capsid protein